MKMRLHFHGYYFIIILMKKFVVGALIAVFAVVSVFAFSSCESERQMTFTDATHFGSALKVVLYCTGDTFAIFSEETERTLDELSRAFDEGDPQSFPARFNAAKQGEKIEIDGVCLEAYAAAEQAFALTDGYYDPTAANLVDLWGFSARFYNSSTHTEDYDRERDDGGAFLLPSEEYVSAFRSLTGLTEKTELVEENGKTYLLKKAAPVSVNGKEYGIKMDFGGVVKGIAVERIVSVCRELGIKRGYVSYGTSSLFLMKNASDSEWDLLLTNPRNDGSENEPKAYFKTALADVSAATSGDYERYYTLDGKRYSHIIDVKTGKPVDNGVCAVTVIGVSPALGDCLATGLLAAGKEKITEFAYSDYAAENGIKIVAAFDDDGEIKVFSTVENYEVLKGEIYA